MPAVVPPSTMDRLKESVQKLVRETFPTIRFLGTYEYTVEAADAKTCTGQPTDDTQGLPPMTGWPMRSCVCGATATPAVGMKCLVTFANGDPSRPIVVGADGPPVTSTLDATATVNVGPSAPAVRVGSAPFPVAFAAPVATVFGALATLFTGLATALTTPPTSTTFTAFAAAAAPLFTTAATACTTAVTKVPTVVLGAT